MSHRPLRRPAPLLALLAAGLLGGTGTSLAAQPRFAPAAVHEAPPQERAPQERAPQERASHARGTPTRDAADPDDWRSATPTPALDPEAVVGIVLDALAHNDPEDAGLAVVFAFASPVNRAVVGPLDRFSDLARDEVYRPLLRHVRAVRGALKVDGDRATQRVVVTSSTGDRVVYTFTLSRQTTGPYKGCWMTDGVTREPRSRLRAPQLA